MLKTIKKQIKSLPSKPGVYFFKDKDGGLLYAGKAVDIKKRVASHFLRTTQSGFERHFIPLVFEIDFIKTKNAKEALILENQVIKKYQPRFNIQWRDDKSYLWVSVTNDEWPRVKIVHQPKLLTKNYQLKTDFIGPFVNTTELKEILRALRKILPFRTCKNSFEKPCLQWHLGLCPAHKNPPAPFFEKRRFPPLQRGVRGDLKKIYQNSLNILIQILRLYAGEPLRLEAYDISNIQGVFATGSMVVFKGTKPEKSSYRKFRIKSVRGANDVAMMREVLERRFKHREWPYPDLILIDGGRIQLNASISQISLFTSHLQATSYRLPAIIALAKREDEIYTEFSPRALKLKKLPISLKLVFQAIRDEAHRFAISYYRKLHRKTIKEVKNFRHDNEP